MRNHPVRSIALAAVRACAWRVATLIMIAFCAQTFFSSAAQGKGLNQEKEPEGPAYRFRETYGVPEDKRLPNAPPEHKIRLTETLKVQTEKGQGAPEINQETQQIIYLERPAQVDPREDVTAVVRRYESAKFGANAEKVRANPQMVQGLYVWVEPRGTPLPRVLSLSKRRLRDSEYHRLSVHPFLPALISLLPVLPVHVGDSWRINDNGVYALTYGQVDHETEGLRGKLLEVRDGPDAGEKTAIMSIVGKAIGFWGGELSVNARIHFQFADSTADVDANASFPAPELINARGMIVKVLLGQLETVTAGSSRPQGSPLKRRHRREVIYNRELVAAPTLPIPESAPQPTVENSWLLMALGDQENPFHLYYPQDYQPVPEPDLGGISLVRQQSWGPDVIILQPNPNGPVNFDAKRTDRAKNWRESRTSAKFGASVTLPAAEWPNREVRRFDAAIEQEVGLPEDKELLNIAFRGYVINFTRKNGLYAEAMTAQDDPAEFFREAEMILKTFGSGKPSGPSTAR